MKVVLSIVLVILTLTSLGVWFTRSNGALENEPKTETVIPASATGLDGQVVSTELNEYMNEEWGIRFEYPQDWEARENSFENFYSKFNVTMYPTKGGYKGRPVVLNIVLPEFAENTFNGLDKETRPVRVDGVDGLQHTYAFRSSTNTSIVLPFGEYTLLLGTNGHYPDLFEGILSSFEFLEGEQ